MSLSQHTRRFARNLVLSTTLLTAVLGMVLAAFGFLVAAFYVWLTQWFGVPGAAGIVGAVLLCIALFAAGLGTAMLRRMRRRQPSLWAELGGTLTMSMRLAGILVRRDPRKAVFLSLLAGALAEYFLSDKKS